MELVAILNDVRKGLSEADIYQILLGFCETSDLTAYIAHRELLEGRSATPRQVRETAREVKLFLDNRMRAAQVAERRE